MLREETNSYVARRQQKDILESARRIAIVGLRPDPIFKSYTRTQKLLEYDLNITPVVSNCESVLGLECYGRVLDIPEPIDIVQFYPDSKADMTQAARDTIEKGAKVFWIEDDRAPDEVRNMLENAGVRLFEFNCLQKEYEEYFTGYFPTPTVSSGGLAKHVGERMTRYPITVRPQEPIQSALEKMKKGHFRHLPVVDKENRLLGMFSDRDLRLMHPNPTFKHDEQTMEKFRATPVGDAASFNPVSVLAGATLEEAAELMLRWNVESLPVIAGEDYLIGIITVSDFLKESIAHGGQKHWHH
jgi:CBS domain-containing protein